MTPPRNECATWQLWVATLVTFFVVMVLLLVWGDPLSWLRLLMLVGLVACLVTVRSM